MKNGNTAYKAAVGLAIATPILLLWVIGAVGVLGVDGDPADLMYIGVIVVGIIGAIIARLQPHGKARVVCELPRRRAEGLTHVPAIESETRPPPSVSWGLAEAPTDARRPTPARRLPLGWRHHSADALVSSAKGFHSQSANNMNAVVSRIGVLHAAVN